jgi:hypothetical protein
MRTPLLKHPADHNDAHQRRRGSASAPPISLRFDRAVERAQKHLLIGVREIGDKTYVWLLQQHPDASKF